MVPGRYLNSKSIIYGRQATVFFNDPNRFTWQRRRGKAIEYKMSSRPSRRSGPSNNYAEFLQLFEKARNVVVLTGAGISAESGIPTFRGAGGLWKQYKAQELATPTAFASDPVKVWQFYSYRRQVALSKQPNQAHYALAQAEERFKDERRLVIITQNIDELHKRSGSTNIIELHGTLFKTRCAKCGQIRENYDSPIKPALADDYEGKVTVEDLPKCLEVNCGGLLRPHVTWFNESLDPNVLIAAEQELDSCDLCLIIGTSSIVYPAAAFAPAVAARNVPVAEFNIESTPATKSFHYFFPGKCGSTLPRALGMASAC